MNNNNQHPASFRDPAGFIFAHEGKFYRQVNQVYADDFEHFKKSGLFDLLVKQQKMLSHTEIGVNFTGNTQWYKTLLPQQLNFIAYPYEWCFSQWKDAALLTLDLVITGISHGMILKDATPFNIQFVDGSPVFIDTLSFEKYDASKSWVAYKQFVECFVAPLLLAKYNTPALLKIFQVYPCGIPLPVVSQLLPFKSRFNANVFLHINLPGLLGGGKPGTQKKQSSFTQQKLLNIINNLHSFVSSLRLPKAVTSWSNYYEETILSAAYAEAKMEIVKGWLKEIKAATVLDIGTNTGLFAEAAAATAKYTVAIDADAACVDKLYQVCRNKNICNLLPMYTDITNPAPAIGWGNEERDSFLSRIKPDLVMALALVHHLAIGANISFKQVACLLSRLTPCLIIEFVPKGDPKVQLLLRDRVDVFSNYTEADFLEAFEKKFTVVHRVAVPGTERLLFWMNRN